MIPAMLVLDIIPEFRLDIIPLDTILFSRMVNFGKTESWLIAKVSIIRIFDKSERSKTSKNSVKIVVSSQNFGRFLSLRPEVVPFSPKISQLLSFQRKFFHLRNRPIIRLHSALSAKK